MSLATGGRSAQLDPRGPALGQGACCPSRPGWGDRGRAQPAVASILAPLTSSAAEPSAGVQWALSGFSSESAQPTPDSRFSLPIPNSFPAGSLGGWGPLLVSAVPVLVSPKLPYCPRELQPCTLLVVASRHLPMHPWEEPDSGLRAPPLAPHSVSGRLRVGGYPHGPGHEGGACAPGGFGLT